jgi:hypothetical protein
VTPSPSAPSALVPLLTESWRRPLLALGGGLLATEALAELLHLPSSTLVGGGVLAGGCWLLSRRSRRLKPRLPSSLAGWTERCERVLEQFTQLASAEQGDGSIDQRRGELRALLEAEAGRPLGLALAGSQPPAPHFQTVFQQALQGPRRLRLHWGQPLPAWSDDWRWGGLYEGCDVLLFHLRMPLRASDLRWLESLPPDQPLWLLMEGVGAGSGEAELRSLWPAVDPERLLFWDGSAAGLASSLAPLASWLARQGGILPERTSLRRLQALHGRWQRDLERLRRGQWQRLQQRTQWVVAAGVLAAPVPSLDVLVLGCANALMLREMARLWDCPWDSEVLRAAALELGRAALGLGLVEWSSQALATALRLHHAGWLLGGALQALSAAYLTRVVGHAMADVLALSAGVSEPDLEAIRQQAPLLVARAAEAEKLDWGAFLEQGREWLRHQGLPAVSTTL